MPGPLRTLTQAEARGDGPAVRSRGALIRLIFAAPSLDPLASRLLSQEYFSAHGADALLVAHQVYKTTNVIKYLGQGSASTSSASYKPAGSTSAGGGSSSTSAITPRGLPSVSISLTLSKAFLRECLTTKQMRVEIYEPEEGAAGRKNHARWHLSRAASPGNIAQVEDLLFAQTDLLANAVSMALKVHVKDGGRTVGCAFVDVQEKLIGVAEFVEDENFGNTEVSGRGRNGARQGAWNGDPGGGRSTAGGRLADESVPPHPAWRQGVHPSGGRQAGGPRTDKAADPGRALWRGHH